MPGRSAPVDRGRDVVPFHDKMLVSPVATADQTDTLVAATSDVLSRLASA